MSKPGKRRVGRRAHLVGIEPRPRCEKEGYCGERDWEGRCLVPSKGCEWNEYERTLLRARAKALGAEKGDG